ncbi:TRAP transporter large permease [Rhodococcus sp. T2V]|uniref:TRAP transporter large permease n=1 Tax=Rhodococcus sp. T2V TaxID=3034164 RepID=UPI0023E28556|nr:TRAP transporter large permease [Rhodococcus sp. T2V]MDF3309673.1 TRAP transporter large permease [Rhodococcus sp. T2V]
MATPVADDKSPRRRKKIPDIVFIGLILVDIALIWVMLFGGITNQQIGILTVILLLTLMAGGLPVGLSMIAASIPGLYSIGGINVVESSVGTLAFSGVASWSLSVLPLFILMGAIVGQSGIGELAYGAAAKSIGRVPGGLAVATNLSGGAMAATSGSSMGITLSLGKIAIPQMLRDGYAPSLATASVAMAGSLGQVIPPSILLVVYAGVAQVPVGPALVAGVVPGILLAAAFSLVIIIHASVNPSIAPRSPERVPFATKLRALPGALPALAIMIVVIGGILLGIVTSTEAAALGVLAALVISVVVRKYTSVGAAARGGQGFGRFLWSSATDAAMTTASIFLILVGSLLLTRTLALTGASQDLTEWLVGMELGRIELLLLLMVTYLILGMFLESLPMILLTVPLLLDPLAQVGVDPIFFGVFIIIMCEIGMVFPPIGFLTFVVHKVAQAPSVNLGQRVSLGAVFRGVMPFVAAAFVVLFVLSFWPDIVMWLPNLSSE